MAITSTNRKMPLQTGTDLSSEPWDYSRRTTPPSLTPAERLADRATWTPAYGSAQIPPAPQWYLSADGEPVGGGWQTSREIQLSWTSGVGAADAAGTYAGSTGLDLAGIRAHHVFVAEAENPLPTEPTKVIGAFTNALLDGLKADTSYRIAVAAVSVSGPGPQSAVLSVRTLPAAA
ncbi:fibronectin type III domain-containing protein [Streptomyces nojiriensis]|uniref:fibronectin type III domain-containing protein n=1 Tax=Streptomyces nojiriensis TaxID=66374 RepID=UPI0036DAD57F